MASDNITNFNKYVYMYIRQQNIYATNALDTHINA